MDITKKYITLNPCYQQARTIVPKGIIVHSLGVPQPSEDTVWGVFNKVSAKTSVHAVVGQNKIYQLMPWNYRSWGCGSGSKGSGNNDYIQFEICEPSGFKYGTGSTMIGYDIKKNQAYFDAVWSNSVDLCVFLCNEYKLSSNTIICHSEGYTKGIASNHGDVMHWFPKHGKSMDDFRKAVQAKMAYKPISPITKSSSKEDIAWLQTQLNKANKGYQIKVNGEYTPQTRNSLLIFATDVKGWDWEGNTGYSAGTATIQSLSKY